jgi:hypothetical protein
MTIPKSTAARIFIVSACALGLAGSALLAQAEKKKKPSISVRATPAAGFSPLRVMLSAEIKGGDDNYEDFYCPSIEWTWGDDTKTESSSDCDPFEEGKSAIKRRYTTTRIFQTYGDYKVEFRLKQKDRVVGAGSTTIQVRPGVRDGGGTP